MSRGRPSLQHGGIIRADALLTVLAHQDAEVDGLAPGGVAVDRYQCRVVNQGQVMGGGDGAVDGPLARDQVHEERGEVARADCPGQVRPHRGPGRRVPAEVHLAGVLVDPERADGHADRGAIVPLTWRPRGVVHDLEPVGDRVAGMEEDDVAAHARVYRASTTALPSGSDGSP